MWVSGFCGDCTFLSVRYGRLLVSSLDSVHNLATERASLDVAAINQRLVLGNSVIFGSVNPSSGHFKRTIS